MQKKLLKSVVLLCSVIVIASCSSNKKEPVSEIAVIDKEQIKKEIQAKEDEFAETYNAGIMKNIGYYADDATTFTQNKGPLVGRQAIVDYLAEGIGDAGKNNKISFKTNEVFVSNDAAQVVEIGAYTLVDSTNTSISTGNYMVLFEKRNGRYYSVRDMSVSDMPLD